MIAHANTPIDGFSLLQRFTAKIKKHNDCWLWTGAVNSKGYPQLWVGGKTLYAHRISHELFIGPVPAERQVHHKCMNPLCVNPAHLEEMTPERNRYLQALGVGEAEDIPF